MDLSFLLNLGGRPTYKSIAEAIAQSIETGLLIKGDKLPSARELALYIQSSRTTVVNAFDHLAAQGYLHSIKGDATYISNNHTSLNKQTPAGQSVEGFYPTYDWQSRYTPLAQKLLLQRVNFVTSGDLSALNYGALPNELLPLRNWRRILAEHCNSENPFALTSKQDVFGYLPLRQAIADLLRRSRGIRCTAEQIVLYSGSQSALTHLMQLLVKPGDIAVCENPSYAGARELFRIHGAHVQTVPVDKEGIIVERLQEINQKPPWLYLTQSGQDPTGVVLSEGRRQKLLEWAQASGATIIEDAWDSDFQYDGKIVPTLQSLDRSGCVIYTHTFWRLLFPLASTAFLVLPEKLIPLFKNSKHIADHQHPLIEHYVLTKFIREGKFEQHIRTSWKILRERRQAMIFALKQSFNDKIQILSNEAAMHVVVRFDRAWDEVEIAQSATQAGLPLVSTASYYADGSAPNEFIVPFAGTAPDQVEVLMRSFAMRLFSPRIT